MADKVEDKKEYQGLKGRFNHSFEGYGDDMRAVREGLGMSKGSVFASTALATAMGTMMGGLVLGFGGGGLLGVTLDQLDGDPALETAFTQSAENQNYHQIIQLEQDDRTQNYMLIHQEGVTYLMSQNGGEFQYVDSISDALEVSSEVISGLDKTIEALESGSAVPEGVDILTPMQATDLSILHTEGGNIEREFEALIKDPDANANFLNMLKDIRAQWSDATQNMAKNGYGLSADAIESLPTDTSISEGPGGPGVMDRTLPYAVLLGFLLGGAYVPGDWVRLTNKRRRERKQRENRNRLRM